MEIIYKRRCATCEHSAGTIERRETHFVRKDGTFGYSVDYNTGLVCGAVDVTFINKNGSVERPPVGLRVEKTFVCSLWQPRFPKRP